MTGPPANETGHQRANAVTRENGSGKETSAKNSTTLRFAVHCLRADGGRRLFGRYATLTEAEAIAQTLRNVGCDATAEVAS